MTPTLATQTCPCSRVIRQKRCAAACAERPRCRGSRAARCFGHAREAHAARDLSSGCGAGCARPRLCQELWRSLRRRGVGKEVRERHATICFCAHVPPRTEDRPASGAFGRCLVRPVRLSLHDCEGAAALMPHPVRESAVVVSLSFFHSCLLSFSPQLLRLYAQPTSHRLWLSPSACEPRLHGRPL